MRRMLPAWAAVLLLASGALLAASPAGVWLDVPFIAQPKNGCGAASMAMVMEYWERDLHRPHSSRADVETIQRALYSKRARGIFASSMERYFQEEGYRTFAIRGEWQDLKENLSKGRPLIVSLEPAGPRDPLHYVVVAGLDWQNNFVFVNDPAQRKLLRISRAEFEKEWHAVGNWTLLPVPQ
jgi:ABC-type bacteriocin/lantibiotic exporter with double-glycine peptidase domain